MWNNTITTADIRDRRVRNSGEEGKIMMRLFPFIYLLAGPTLGGILMIVALVMRTSNAVMLWLIAAGFIIAIPISWVVAKMIIERSGDSSRPA